MSYVIRFYIGNTGMGIELRQGTKISKKAIESLLNRIYPLRNNITKIEIDRCDDTFCVPIVSVEVE